ncbi:MAG: hypothetical protein CMH58_02265 [Myxococcales bacterium]|nr:hypothetical protein [Myxococcales bacterium]
MVESKQNEVPQTGKRKIRKITIEDFMSHERTVLEFADGITLLSGDNNCGKSAVVVALEAICGMTQGGWMVRHNAKQAKVTLHLEDEDGTAHEVEWRRKKKTHGWTVDGTKSDRGKPENLHEVLRMGEVKKKTGPGSFNVHFAPQKDPIFLLNDTGSHRAEFFTTAGDAQLLLAMRQKLKSKQREASGSLTRCESEIKISEARIEALGEVPEMVDSVDALSKRRAALLEGCEKISQLSGARQHLLLAEVEQKLSQDRFDALAGLPEVPETEDLEGLQAMLSDITNSENVLSSLSQKIGALEVVPDPPELVDTAACEEILDGLTVFGRNLRQAEETCEALEGLPEDFPQVADNSMLESQIAALRSRTSELGEGNEELRKIEGELKSVQADWEELVKKHERCPTCGSVLDEKHLEKLHDKG